MPQEPSLRTVSHMMIRLGEIITRANQLFIALLEAGTNTTDMIALIREQTALELGYLTSIQAIVEQLRTGGDHGT